MFIRVECRKGSFQVIYAVNAHNHISTLKKVQCPTDIQEVKLQTKTVNTFPYH